MVPVVRRRPAKRPESWVRIAGERIDILLGLAGKEAKKHPERARRYVELARKIGMRYNVRLGGRKRWNGIVTNVIMPFCMNGCTPELESYLMNIVIAYLSLDIYTWIY